MRIALRHQWSDTLPITLIMMQYAAQSHILTSKSKTELLIPENFFSVCKLQLKPQEYLKWSELFLQGLEKMDRRIFCQAMDILLQ